MIRSLTKPCLLLLTMTVCLSACLNKVPDTQNKTPPDGCYIYCREKDTVYLSLQTKGPSVTGRLVFQYFEKDKNEGAIRGEMKGDTLWAEYTFNSEGKTSTRDVIFLRKAGNFTEGFGKLDSVTGEPDLSDRAAIHFNGRMILKKVDCGEWRSVK